MSLDAHLQSRQKGPSHALSPEPGFDQHAHVDRFTRSAAVPRRGGTRDATVSPAREHDGVGRTTRPERGHEPVEI